MTKVAYRISLSIWILWHDDCHYASAFNSLEIFFLVSPLYRQLAWGWTDEIDWLDRLLHLAALISIADCRLEMRLFDASQRLVTTPRHFSRRRALSSSISAPMNQSLWRRKILGNHQFQYVKINRKKGWKRGITSRWNYNKLFHRNVNKFSLLDHQLFSFFTLLTQSL